MSSSDSNNDSDNQGSHDQIDQSADKKGPSKDRESTSRGKGSGLARGKSGGKNKKSGGPPIDNRWQSLWWYLPLALLLLWVWQDVLYSLSVQTIPYSEFKQRLTSGDVVVCEVRETEIIGRIRKPEFRTDDPATPSENDEASPNDAESDVTSAVEDSGDYARSDTDDRPGDETEESQTAEDEAELEKTTFIFRTVRIDDTKLVEQLSEAGVEFSGVRPSILSQFLLGWIIPLGIMVALWIFLARRMGASGQTALSIGKSRAKLVADDDTGVTFEDVAGCDEAKFELQEVVDFLQNPKRYANLGAKIPKGVLLVGPPGTGKTMLAKAVAGEAKAPFFSLSGSDFVEMFVGVGASRVRDLFQQATNHAPCIIFIDELDAIGRERGVHIGPVNDEREQTLNQLLVEMDGFEPNTGVLLLAATNRPEVLDRALLRPGRFDRQVVVDAPDIDGREAILKVHSRDKPLSDTVDLRQIAQATPGFSGADLANVMNEAALLTARRGADVIHHIDIDEAVEKVIAGPERKSRRLSESEKRRVAYHEVGHALVGAHSEHADPVHKISIVPRGSAALGYTLQLPTEEQFLVTQSELFDRIKGLLGGRAAEELIFGETSTGAQNDLERASNLAKQMVTMYGMSDSIGLLHCGRTSGRYLRNSINDNELDCSEKTAEEVDREVRQLLQAAYNASRQILNEHRDQLERVSLELLEKETLDAKNFYELVGMPNPGHHPVSAAAQREDDGQTDADPPSPNAD